MQRIAISHDWLNGMRGGEKCLELILDAYPESEIYTLLYEKAKLSSKITSKPIHISWLNKVPFAGRFYKYLLFLFPSAIRSFEVRACDAVISTSHCVAKGIRVPRGTKHLCYCFTPMRYAWLFFDEYFGRFPRFLQSIIRRLLYRLRIWDVTRNKDVTQFVAISEHVKKRIHTFYGRDAQVIYPPVDTHFFTPTEVQREGFYLIVSALVPYKRVDLAVQAFRKLGWPLKVIGQGPEEKRLRAMAGPQTEFLGWCSNEALRDAYRKCKALIFPGEEDFGIVPLEAASCGAPVLALARGGARETILDGETGVFFSDPTVISLVDALMTFQEMSWDETHIRKHAESFSQARFVQEFKEAMKKMLGTDVVTGVK